MRFFISIVLLFISAYAIGQNPVDDTTKIKSDSVIWIPVEVTAQYPGGMAQMFKFIQRNQKYPKDAWKAGIEGKVRVLFVVEKDGSISNARVTEPVHAALDAEAIRVILLMPKWKPAMVKDQPVRSQFSIPILFRKD